MISLLLLLTCFNASPALSAGEQVDYSAASGAVKPFLSKSYTLFKQGHPLFQLGGFWGTAGDRQHLNIHGLVGNTYTVNNQTTSNALVGVGYFLEGQAIRFMRLSYGLNWFYLPKTSYYGTVTQENLFTNLSYRYEITHYPLYATVKSTSAISESSKYALAVNVGIGPNFMKTAHYREKLINSNSVPNTPFPGKATTTFSATVGGGIKRNNVFGGAPLECGYRFFYLGQGNFGRNSNQLNTFTTGSAYANAILCSISI